MTTYREAINRVLTALGQADDLVSNGATELSDAYHLKVAEFFNDIHEQVEDAAQWRVLRQRDTVTITASALSGTLAAANERSRVFRVQDERLGELVPLVFDVTDSDNQTRLKEMDLAALLFLDQQNSNQATGNTPSHFALEQTAAGCTLYVWPRCDTERSIEADMVIPQSRLAIDDLDEVIKVPATPVVLGARWLALDDRGEELGEPTQRAEKRFSDALSDKVAAENAAQGFDELVPV